MVPIIDHAALFAGVCCSEWWISQSRAAGGEEKRNSHNFAKIWVDRRETMARQVGGWDIVSYWGDGFWRIVFWSLTHANADTLHTRVRAEAFLLIHNPYQIHHISIGTGEHNLSCILWKYFISLKDSLRYSSFVSAYICSWCRCDNISSGLGPGLGETRHCIAWLWSQPLHRKCSTRRLLWG